MTPDEVKKKFGITPEEQEIFLLLEDKECNQCGKIIEEWAEYARNNNQELAAIALDPALCVPMG